MSAQVSSTNPKTIQWVVCNKENINRNLDTIGDAFDKYLDLDQTVQELYASKMDVYLKEYQRYTEKLQVAQGTGEETPAEVRVTLREISGKIEELQDSFDETFSAVDRILSVADGTIVNVPKPEAKPTTSKLRTFVKLTAAALGVTAAAVAVVGGVYYFGPQAARDAIGTFAQAAADKAGAGATIITKFAQETAWPSVKSAGTSVVNGVKAGYRFVKGPVADGDKTAQLVIRIALGTAATATTALLGVLGCKRCFRKVPQNPAH